MRPNHGASRTENEQEEQDNFFFPYVPWFFFILFALPVSWIFLEQVIHEIRKEEKRSNRKKERN
jgi:flagellar biosynthesis/type III secretory pathway M-ring protein FliF/YscJ